MRVEQQDGHHILCGHFLAAAEVLPGQLWIAAGTTQPVTVNQVNDEWLTYLDAEGHPCIKDTFSFQCRYSLILASAEIPDWLL